MTDDTVLETTIHEPSMTAGEAEMLLFALERSRAQFAWKCGGLDAAGLGQPAPAVDDDPRRPGQAPGPGRGLDCGVELNGPGARRAVGRGRLRVRPRLGVAHRRPRIHPRSSTRCGGEPWRGRGPPSPRCWRTAASTSPSKLTTDAGESPNVRRILVDLHDEYARHVGHADLLREAVDGLVGEDPPQP